MSGTLDVGNALKIGNKDVEVYISKSWTDVRSIQYYPKRITSLASLSSVHPPQMQ